MSCQLYRSILCKDMIRLLVEANILLPERIFNRYGIPIDQRFLPCIYVSAPLDHAKALTVGTPIYERTATLVLQVFLNFTDPVIGTERLDKLCYRIEQAFQCDESFQRKIQSIPSFRVETLYHTEPAFQIAEARFEIECQYNESFYPDPESDLTGISGTMTVN